MLGLRKATWVMVTASASLVAAAGCQSNGARRIVSAEPGLSGSVEPGATVVEGAPLGARQVTWVDRHPLFSKPREYYDNSTSKSKVVRAATATVVGVPVGFVGEIRQIVSGNPTPPR